MLDFISNIAPIILLAVIGFSLKAGGFFKTSHADLFMKVVFYIAIPGLILSSFNKLELDLKLLYLPFIASFILLFNFTLSLLIGKIINLPKPIYATFVIGSSILNTGFILPFIVTIYGNEGIVRWMLFDIGNITLVLTLLYYFACKMGSNGYSFKKVLYKLVISSPIIALIIALFVNISGYHLPDFILSLSEKTGALVIPLIMLSLGIYFNPKILNAKLLTTTIFIRMVIGFSIGYAFCLVFNLQGWEKTIVILCASSPVGFNTITLASLENLDKEFAASLVSVSIAIGIFTVPILLYLIT